MWVEGVDERAALDFFGGMEANTRRALEPTVACEARESFKACALTTAKCAHHRLRVNWTLPEGKAIHSILKVAHGSRDGHG